MSPYALTAKAAAFVCEYWVDLYEGRGEARVQVGVLSKVRTWDKVKALALLAKHLGLFKERLEHSGPEGGPLVVEVRKYGPEGES